MIALHKEISNTMTFRHLSYLMVIDDYDDYDVQIKEKLVSRKLIALF